MQFPHAARKVSLPGIFSNIADDAGRSGTFPAVAPATLLDGYLADELEKGCEGLCGGFLLHRVGSGSFPVEGSGGRDLFEGFAGSEAEGYVVLRLAEVGVDVLPGSWMGQVIFHWPRSKRREGIRRKVKFHLLITPGVEFSMI